MMLKWHTDDEEAQAARTFKDIYIYIYIFLFFCLPCPFSFCFGLFCFVVSSLETISARLFNVRKYSKCDKMRNKVKL